MSIEKIRCTVEMHTRLVVSNVFIVRCWMLYSAGNFRCVSEMVNLSNSSLVCLPRLDRSTRNKIRLASAYLISR